MDVSSEFNDRNEPNTSSSYVPLLLVWTETFNFIQPNSQLYNRYRLCVNLRGRSLIHTISEARMLTKINEILSTFAYVSLQAIHVTCNNTRVRRM